MGKEFSFPCGRAAFMQSDCTPESAWLEHIPFAFWLIEYHAPTTFVELGTHAGGSYLAFCQAVARLNRPTQCFAVDTWRGDEHAGHYGDEVYTTLATYHDERYAAFSRLVRTTFDDALNHFEDGAIDLLHIDGLHTEDAVQRDFDSWLPKLSGRGIALFHDVNVREKSFGVHRVWAKLSQRYPHFTFTHGHGLGVLAVGPEQRPELRNLFAAQQDERSCQEIRSIFSRLGRGVSAHRSLLVEQQRVADTRVQLGQLTDHYEALERERNALASDLRDVAASDLQRQHALRAEQQRVTEVRAELAQLTDHYAALERERDALATKVRELIAESDQVKQRYDAVASERDELRSEALTLDQKLAESLSARTAAEEKRVQIASNLARLESDMALMERRIAEQDYERFGLVKQLEELSERAQDLESAMRSGSGLIGALGRLLLDRARHVRNRIASRLGPPSSTTCAQIVDEISGSGLFDSTWYLANYPDVAAAQLEPVLHYVQAGAGEGRKPNLFFDPHWYLERYPDVRTSGLDPLLHYIRFGAKEGRPPGPDFDPEWYLQTYEDVASAGLSPLEHFMKCGKAEGRQPTKGVRYGAGASFFSIKRTRDWGALNPRLLPSTLTRPDARAKSVDVIVPVYDGYEETLRCLKSVLACRRFNRSMRRLVVVYDCGPNSDLRDALSSLKEVHDFELLYNETNLGFVGSVNRAMRAAADVDVILLNSDTEVNGDWVDRLAAHAQVDESIATITPFSNNATICSYPWIGGEPGLPPGLSLKALDESAAASNVMRNVDVPTGVGFCMFVRRRCLDEIGYFDEEAFGKGYGEETDFCLKARDKGWRNILAGDVFVFHEGGVSFAETADSLRARAGSIVNARYPLYRDAVREWIHKDPAYAMRFALGAAALRATRDSVVLHIVHPWGGGTERHIAEAISENAEATHIVLSLGVGGAELTCSLLWRILADWERLDFSVVRLDELAPLLRAFGVSQVNLHHAQGRFEELMALVTRLDAKLSVTVHDYSSICPKTYLVRDGVYCGEPVATECSACLLKHDETAGTDIVWWRERALSLLEDADEVLCPSADVMQRLQRYVPSARFRVNPHQPEFYRRSLAAMPPALREGEPLRVTTIGMLAGHKGGRFLLDCIRSSRVLSRSVKWTVIGEFGPTEREEARALQSDLTVTGAYAANEIARLIHTADPHVILFPQRCPETYSYTLSEAFEARRVVLAPRLGAFTERLVNDQWGWLYPPDIDPTRLLETLLEMARVNFLNNVSAAHLDIETRQPDLTSL